MGEFKLDLQSGNSPFGSKSKPKPASEIKLPRNEMPRYKAGGLCHFFIFMILFITLGFMVPFLLNHMKEECCHMHYPMLTSSSTSGVGTDWHIDAKNINNKTDVWTLFIWCEENESKMCLAS